MSETVKGAAGPVPSTIIQDEELNASIAAYLPPNYSFEIHKTVHHVRHYGATCVALQMPEGLTLWATAISDIIERFTDASTVIMGDVTYGACCVDDFTARALGADLLVHYGHSCLVPVDQTSIRTLYVFVEIAVDVDHIRATIRSNFPSSQAQFRAEVLDRQNDIIRPSVAIALEESDEVEKPVQDRPTHLVLVATVQFINALHGIRESLEIHEEREQFYDAGRAINDTVAGAKAIALEPFDSAQTAEPHRKHTWYSSPYRVTIPQIKPLSAGEILGCTSPNLPAGIADSVDAVIYVGDGRFHLESIMIANPDIPAFRYDPYEKRFVRERYDHVSMRNSRARAVNEAKESVEGATVAASEQDVSDRYGWGLILGTLGRQGSTRVLDHLRGMLKPSGMPHIPILLSELSPQKLSLFGEHMLTFVQTSCPRLSIDWGEAFSRPLLSPYEAAVALGKASGWRSDITPGANSVSSQDARVDRRFDRQDGAYPMDFYADDSLGSWTPRHGMGQHSTRTKGVSNRELLKRGRMTKRNVMA